MFKLKRLVSVILVFTISFIHSIVWSDIGANEDLGSFSRPYESSGASAAAAPESTATSTSSAGPIPAGYTTQAKQIQKLVLSLTKQVEGLAGQGAMFPKLGQIKELESAVSIYANSHSSCIKTQGAAEYVCNEKTNPGLHKTLNDVNTVVGMISGVAVNDACGSLAKAMNLAQIGLTTYTVACSAARTVCETACTITNNNLKKIDTISKMGFNIYQCNAPAASTPEMKMKIESECAGLLSGAAHVWDTVVGTVVKDSDLNDILSIGAKNKACTYSYTNMILSAGVGITSIIKSLQQAKQCDKDSSGDPNKKDEDVCKDATKVNTEACKCKVPDSPECICFKNPRTSGCANAFQKPNENSAQNFGLNDPSGSGKGSGSSSGGPSGISMNDNGVGENKATGSEGGGAGGAGAPMGSGAGLGGGGGGGTGKGAEIEAARKGFNANILSGAGGGGGGGWGGSSGGGSSEKYRAYLPGGAKDPSRGVAGQQSWIKEVTGQGGKSNWEKVRERYQDNKNTLLNN